MVGVFEGVADGVQDFGVLLGTVVEVVTRPEEAAPHPFPVSGFSY